MEKRKITVKTIGIIAAVAAIIVTAIVVVVLRFAGSKDAYRSIQIYEMEGDVSIERKAVGTIDAVEKLYLESGDSIHVSKDSYMRLKLDDDKYILVEEDSVISLVAEGDEKNSKTSIQLEKGAIVNEIQDKLNSKSSYKVNTPNSVMAVRGTVFRVEVDAGENDEIDSKVNVFEGKVGVQLVNSDGALDGEELIIEKGKEMTVHSDESGVGSLSEAKDIDYSVLPLQCLEFLSDVIDNERELEGIDKDELEKLIVEAKDSENDTDEETQSDSDSGSHGGVPLEASNATGADSNGAAGSETSNKAANNPSVKNNGGSKLKSDSVPTEHFAPEPSKDITDKSESPNEQGGNNTPANGGGPAPTNAPVNNGEPTKTNAPVNNGGPTPTNTPVNGGGPTKTEAPNKTEKPELEPRVYTVTFVYNGRVFGTQSVEEGKTVARPKLAPSKTGNWDFDFSTEITKNVTISWK